jgi:UDP-arabinose 4-epimerase
VSTVLVAGGAGYVGSHCCKAFAEAGWQVVAYDSLFRGWRDLVRWGPLVEADVLDRAALDRAFAQYRPDLVAHFAALAYVGESVQRPGAYHRVNGAGTLNILEAMRGADCQNIIFSSSCATYGLPRQIPMDETHPQQPINPYGWSKLIAERMLADFGEAYGIGSVALRYFNAAGADPAAETGERHQPETHIIPLAIESALGGTDFTINGDDYDTGDGTAVRDYVHVADLAQAHLLAAELLVSERGRHAFNLGTGAGLSVIEILGAVERVCERKIGRRIGPRRPGDPPALVATGALAQSVLGWRPQVSAIDTIVETALAWRQAEAARAAGAAKE